MSSGLQMTRRIRRTPYTSRVEAAGVRGFTVVNHMLLPKAFGPSVEEDYWHLKEHCQIWDVSTQRQVELRGPDASRLVQWMTPRDVSNAKVGDCLYVPIIDANAGMINDPVLLKLAEDHFWFSIADSDLLLWAKGLATGMRLDVSIGEPDVSPLAVQGPLAESLLAECFGDAIRSIGFFKFGWIEFMGTRQLVARSGYSKQGGFEIYLNGSHLGEALWDTVCSAGKAHNLRPGCPNLIERIEGGLLSYGNEFTLENNPLECGLENFCSLAAGFDFIGREPLIKIAERGPERLMRGILFDGPKHQGAVTIPWKVYSGERQVGQITSGIWSPKYKRHVGLSMIERESWGIGEPVLVQDNLGNMRPGEVSALPFG